MPTFDLSTADAELKSYLNCDAELLRVALDFKILTLIEWPKKTQTEFLAAYKNGTAKIPQIEYPKYDFVEPLKILESIMSRTEGDHPVAQYLHQTARSYFLAHKLVENLGKPEMQNYSVQVYGRPGDIIAGSKYTSLDAAKFFIEITDQFEEYYDLEKDEICVLAETVKAEIEAGIKQVITDDKVDVYIDENLVPKAAAGVSRVRLRSGTCFSRYDAKQLLEHEVYVHSLTALNGKHQPFLKSMSLGAPRTTATQEGLATFAELVTGAIDLSRLKRIALRVIAVHMAMHGANFMEVFEYFRANKQSDSESFSSARRIFRAGNPNGGSAFTKDAVYLDGLLHTHSFFRWAMKNHKLALSHILFSGRMTFEDAEILAPLADTGLIRGPKYLPPWVSQIPTLGGYLAFSLFANKISVGGLDQKFAKK